MVFQKILHRAVRSVDGAIGAMFVDSQGEAVETASWQLSRYDLAVIGAYQGIYLDRLRQLCRGSGFASPARFKIGFEKAMFLTWAMTDEYFLVLILRPDANEGIAWRQLDLARQEILKEIL